MVAEYLDFEKPIADLERQIEELSRFATPEGETAEEIRKLKKRVRQLLQKTYAHLTPWQRVLIARHPNRPYTLDYIQATMIDFLELHGDRRYGDDSSIVGGFARLDGETVMVIGHQKGRTTKEKIYRNFGMPHPEGYRKALRLMRLAEKFGKPILTFIDTPGAYPGVGAEERGQSLAIAENLWSMIDLRVPVIATVIGEGGSGGALALGIADRILMTEHAVYSVISPEGCAAILWKSSGPEEVAQAAEALKLTAQDLLGLGIIDEIVSEPLGGAHRDPEAAANTLGLSLRQHLRKVRGLPPETLMQQRYEKYRRIGVFGQEEPESRLRSST
jgi:acetyl-CoA carboxylase carboxyl transferase subunit alpha